jgi:hypothetical protein
MGTTTSRRRALMQMGLAIALGPSVLAACSDDGATAPTGDGGADGAAPGDDGGGQDANAADGSADGQGPPPKDAGPSPNTPLKALAAGMAPGTWLEVKTATNQNAALGVGTVSGSMTHYCNSMPWNPFDHAIEIVGMDHNAGMQRYVRYDALTNDFQVIMADTGVGSATRHGYDHGALNPYTGDLYHRLAEYDYEGSGPLVRKLALGAKSFSNLARPKTLFYMTNAIGVCWWSGTFTGAGAQGCLLVFDSGDSKIGGAANDGGMYGYDPLTNAWFWTSDGMAPYFGSGGSATYHSVLEYSSVHNCAVYGGGNAQPKKLWRLGSDRKFVAMPDTPGGTAVGIQAGNLVDDPVTGNFLLVSNGQLWELDPRGAGKWTQRPSPPAGVGNPGPSSYGALDGVISCSIDEYGVVAYVKQTSKSGGTFFLYKNA